MLTTEVLAGELYVSVPSLVNWLEVFAQVLEEKHPKYPPHQAIRNAAAELLLRDLRDPIR